MTYLTTVEQRKALCAESLTWADTPFVHGAQVKGAGASCSTFLSAVFNAALGTHIVIPDHVEQWYLNEKKQLYLIGLEREGFVEISADKVLPGDLCVSPLQSEIYCHAGMILNWPKPPSIIHCSSHGVTRVHSLYASWFFARQPDKLKFFSWGKFL